MTVDGLTHTWPSVAVGEPDNVVADGPDGERWPRPPGDQAGAAGQRSNGDAQGTLTITYTDGSTPGRRRSGFSDWTLGGGGARPSFGNRIGCATPYRNAVSGQIATDPTYVFATRRSPSTAQDRLPA